MDDDERTTQSCCEVCSLCGQRSHPPPSSLLPALQPTASQLLRRLLIIPPPRAAPCYVTGSSTSSPSHTFSVAIRVLRKLFGRTAVVRSSSALSCEFIAGALSRPATAEVFYCAGVARVDGSLSYPERIWFRCLSSGEWRGWITSVRVPVAERRHY